MPRAKLTKFAKGGGKNGFVDVSCKKVRVQLEHVDGRVREGRDFYRVVQPTKQVEKAQGIETPRQVSRVGPEEGVASAVIDTAFQIHTGLGPGLLESVYEVVMAHELRALGFKVDRQVPIAIRYKEIVFEKAFVADLVVDNLVIVELKSVEHLAPLHAKQLLTQIRLMQKRLGLLINFGGIHLKDNIRRLANGLGVPSKLPPSPL